MALGDYGLHEEVAETMRAVAEEFTDTETGAVLGLVLANGYGRDSRDLLSGDVAAPERQGDMATLLDRLLEHRSADDLERLAAAAVSPLQPNAPILERLRREGGCSPTCRGAGPYALATGASRRRGEEPSVSGLDVELWVPGTVTTGNLVIGQVSVRRSGARHDRTCSASRARTDSPACMRRAAERRWRAHRPAWWSSPRARKPTGRWPICSTHRWSVTP